MNSYKQGIVINNKDCKDAKISDFVNNENKCPKYKNPGISNLKSREIFNG